MARPVAAQPSLFSSMNVTPFIDVLLVLIVMLIMTIPVASHKLPLDLPGPDRGISLPATPHTLAIDAKGALAWDGRPIAEAELPALLAGTARSESPLIFDPEALARYERVDQVLATVRRAGVSNIAFPNRYRLDE